MTYPSSIKGFLSATNLRWLAPACVVVTCVGLAVVVTRSRREDVALSRVGGAPMTTQGFRTFVYDNDRLQLSVSGDLLTVSNVKLLGPFHLGLVHSLAARGVTVETFPDTEVHPELGTHQPSFKRILASIGPSLNRALVSLMPERLGVAIAYAEFGPLKVIQHEGTQATVIFQAAACRTQQGLAQVVCKDGMIQVQGSEVPFRELSYDGRSWTLRTILGQRKVVDELTDLPPDLPPG